MIPNEQFFSNILARTRYI